MKFLSMIMIVGIFIGCASSSQDLAELQMQRIVQTLTRNDAEEDPLDTALREATDYFNETLPNGSKLVILSIASASVLLSDYIIDELIANVVNDRIFTVVDRQQLDQIRNEQQFQLSMEVDDKTATDVGRFLGAQTILLGTIVDIGGRHRLSIRALDVMTAQVRGQFNRNIPTSTAISAMVNRGGRPNVAGTRPTTTQGANQTPVSHAQAPITPPAPQIQGTTVPGSTLTEKFAWMQRNADSHNTYILEVNANETISGQTFSFPGALNITIVLIGVGENHSLRLRENGSMFTIPANVTLVLDQNITLHGHNGNTAPIVIVNGGAFRMREGAMITGNVRTPVRDGGAGAVNLDLGTFEMTGGTISHNTAAGNGGGVRVLNGTFTMNAGMISHNTAINGGGVQVFSHHHNQRPVFNFNGGTISNNSSSNGGGVWVGGGNGIVAFTMNGGNITHNIADNGGGIYHARRHTAANIRGGIISSNIAHLYGGGVFLTHCRTLGSAYIYKTGGTITGFSTDPSNGNVVRDNDGELPRRGHAVWLNENHRKETTLGPRDNLSTNRRRFVGW